MSNIPITSRIKRSPLLKYSPLKSDEKDPKAKKYGKEEGEDKKEIKEVEKKSSYEGKKMSAEEWNALTPEKRRELNAAVGANEKGEIITKTKEEVITPGEDLDYDTTIMKTKKEGTMLQPWEVRQQLRGQTRADRQVNKTRRKMEKYGTFDKEGNFTANTDLSDRDKRKLQQAKSGYAAAQSMSKNISTGIEGGRAAGESYFKGQREKLKGEQTQEEQLESARQEAIRNAKKEQDELARQEAIRNAKAENQKITTSNYSQAGAAIDPTSVFTSNFNPDDFSIDYKFGDYSNIINKKAPLEMNSSPAKKALKGNQYKLPQHLQNKIKAAPDKIKTPLKKGYFKNK
jgi:hypothetical protein